jgi:hypothetical protein
MLLAGVLACMNATRVAASLLLLSLACASTPAYEQRGQPVDGKDLQILTRAEEILSDESRWDRHDTRTCQPAATSRSLFCALQEASVDVLGAYDHRRAALQEVRFAIEEVAKRDFEHRLMDFNNLPTTTFADVRRVLAIAKERVRGRLQ